MSESDIIELEDLIMAHRRMRPGKPMEILPDELESLCKMARELKTAVKYLREGKAKFAPHTDNSFVDDFLKKHSGTER